MSSPILKACLRSVGPAHGTEFSMLDSKISEFSNWQRTASDKSLQPAAITGIPVSYFQQNGCEITNNSTVIGNAVSFVTSILQNLQINIVYDCTLLWYK